MEVSGESQRWQGPKSDFPWEQRRLTTSRASCPTPSPTAPGRRSRSPPASGHVREVDLFIATPGGLFLVEIKSHPGRATNNGSTWLFRDDGKTRTIENPLHFTDLKAKELKSQLEWAARQLEHPRAHPADRGRRLPVRARPSLRVRRVPAPARLRPRRPNEQHRSRASGRTSSTSRRPASETASPPRSPSSCRSSCTRSASPACTRSGGSAPTSSSAKSFDAGPTWEDYLAHNPSLPNDQPRRVRVYLTERTATDDERRSTQRAARREYLALQGISHDGIVRAEQYSDELLAGPAVVFRHGRDWQRLDHFMASHETLELDTRLEMIRQLAEALDHAHRRHLYHRALAARCVYVELDGRYPRLRIADWQVAARPPRDGHHEYHAVRGPRPRTAAAPAPR